MVVPEGARAPLAAARATSDPQPPEAVSGAAWLAIGAVASKGAQTLVLLVFAAVLSPDAFGVISLGAVLLNVTTVLADLGTSTALVHFRGDAERAARTALTIALTVGCVLVLLVWLAAPGFADALQAGDLGTGVFRGIVLCVPFAAVAGVSGELLRRALDFRRRVLPDIAGNVVGAAVTIGALAVGEGAFSLVYGQVVQAIVVLLLFWAIRRPVRPGWSRADATSLVGYGAGLAGSGLLTLLMLNVDYVLVANRLGVHDLGVYSMAFRVAYMPYLLIAMVVGGAVFAHLCRLRGTAVWRATVDAARVLHAFVVPAYVGVIVLAPQLQLLGERWAAAVPALRWLAAYGLALSALELLLVALKAVGRTSDVLGLGALHVGMLLVLLGIYVDSGVTAVAVVQFAAGVATLAAAVVVTTSRLPGTEWGSLLRRLAPVAAAAAAMAAAGLALQRVLPWAQVSAPGLVLVALFSAATYASTLFLLERGRRPRTAQVRRLRVPSVHLPSVHVPEVRRSGRGRAPRIPGDARRVAVYGAVAVACAGAGALAVGSPYATLLGLVAVAAVGAAILRVEWAAMAYVAAEPFGDLLRDVHPDAIKVMGALLFVSWLVRVVQDPRLSLIHHGLYAVGALVLAVLASFVLHGADLAVGLDHTVTYASYALVVVVLVDTIRRGRPDPLAFGRRLAVAFALSCTAAGVIASVGFLAHGGRAGGPLSDPNDLAFFMIAALPMLLVVRRRSVATTVLLMGCAAVLVVTTFATFSRGALLGLAVMAVVAVLLGAVRLTTAVSLGVVAAVVLGALWLTHGDVVSRSLEEKDHIAAANVDTRLTTATMAAEMTVASPLVGQGPGGFAASRAEFAPAGTSHVDQTVAHQMYLDVSSELGLLGLGAFLAILAYGVRGALRARTAPERRPLANATLIAFAGVLVAACFLSEQLYLPVWLLVALGIALEPALRPRRT